MVQMQSERYSVYSARLLIPGVVSDRVSETKRSLLRVFLLSLFLLMTWNLLVLC